jgi:hypothetical protein
MDGEEDCAAFDAFDRIQLSDSSIGMFFPILFKNSEKINCINWRII